MRRIVGLLLILLAGAWMPAPAAGQVPQVLNYQGRLATDGDPATGPHAVTFSIYPAATGGSALWTETHDAVAVAEGVFSVLLGSEEPFPANLFSTNDELYLGIQVNDGPEMTPRLQFASAPYALTAQVGQLAAGSVTTAALANGSVTAEKIAPGVIPDGGGGGGGIADGSVTTAKLADDAVTAAKLADTAAVLTLNDMRGAVTLVPGSSNVTIQRNESSNELAILVTGGNDGGGEGGITAVHAGDGLESEVRSGEVTLSLAPSGVMTRHLQVSAVDSTKIANDAIGTGELKNGAVTAAKLASNAAVLSLNGARGAVALAEGDNVDIEVSGNTLTISSRGGLIGGGGDITAVTTPTGSGLSGGRVSGSVELSIANNGVTTARIQNEAVTTAKLDDGAVTAVKLATESVGTDALQDEAVTAPKLDNGAVTSAKIAPAAIGTTAIADGAVTAAKIAPGVIPVGGIADESVTTEKLADGAVTSDKIAPGAVVEGQIAIAAIGAAQLQDGAVTVEKIAEGAVVTGIVAGTGSPLTGGITIQAGDGVNITSDGAGSIVISVPPDEDEGVPAAAINSSRRWKHEIQTLEDPLETLQKLRGVRYRWNETGEADVGLIAEEVGEVVPEVVTYAENGVDAEGVEYAKLVAVLIEAVKAQQEQIASQQSQLDALSERLGRLERQTSGGTAATQPTSATVNE